MSARRKSEPRRLGRSLARVLSELGHGPVADALLVTERWEEAVGAEVAAHAQPVGLSNGTLEIAAESSTWSHELQLRRDELLAGLHRVLGEKAPSSLRFRVGLRRV